jgi:hypothetical protein
MWTVLFRTAVIAGIVWISIAPAKAASATMPGIGNTNFEVASVERVGYRRRYYRRYGYPVPYAYYPPAYGYYVSPSPYSYPYPPPHGYYAEPPPPDGAYADAPPPDGYYTDTPEDGAYGDAPPPEGY